MRTLIIPEAMYGLEKQFFDAGNPSLPVMQKAASEVVRIMEADAGTLIGKQIAVACGGGNNAGDGYWAAVLASRKGADVTILTVKPVSELSGDAFTCANTAVNEGLRLVGDPNLIPKPDYWIDALFGIGLKRNVEGAFAEAIDRINADGEQGARVVAVDVPSGLDPLNGNILGHCIKADITVTFQYAKTGHYLNDGLDMCGRVEVCNIGITGEASGYTYLVEDADCRLPKRKRNIHKGTCGHLLVIAGSRGMCGAAMYAAKAAMRTGCGLVTIACPDSCLNILQTLCPEAMCIPLPEENGAISAYAADTVRAAMKGKDAVAIGPGLSTRASAKVIGAVLDSGLSVVIDADALNIIARSEELKGKLSGNHILTPHPGEAARLVGKMATVETAKELEKLGAVVVLKGASSIICHQYMLISTSGCAGMAKGGSGDVLTGMIASLLAQGMKPRPAAWLGSHLHGLSGEAAAKAHGEYSMTAMDIIDAIEKAIT